MNSSAIIGKISVCGEDFAKKLDKKGFLLISRGEIMLKGKGFMQSYWLMSASGEEHIVEYTASELSILSNKASFLSNKASFVANNSASAINVLSDIK